MWTRVENGGRSLLARITIIQCSYVRDLALSLRFPTKSDLTFRWSTWNSLLESAVIHSIESRIRHARSNSKKFDSLLLAKGCQHICLPKSKHHSLGVPEKVIGDLDRNTRVVMADANIPPMCWDIVVQHVALLNACTSPAVCDPSITICWGWQGCCSWSRCVSTARVLLSSLPSEQISNWMRKMNLEYF